MRMRRARYLAGDTAPLETQIARDCLCGPAILTHACAPAWPAERARTTAGTIQPASGVLWRTMSPFWIDLVGSDDGGWDGSEEETQYPDYNGEIKGPGPFRSMSLVLLVVFRDLWKRRGPGFSDFSKLFIGLSGTFRGIGRDV